MDPEDTPQTPREKDDQAHADERACAERVSYWLKKYGCDLQAIATLRSGQVAMRIDIVKIPPEVLKKIRQAEKEGQGVRPGFTEQASS